MLFYSCNGPYPSFEVDELYVQKVKGSSLYIYDYYASGGFDAVKQGFSIQDSSEKFEISKVEGLPISNFADIPNADVINTVHTVYPEDRESFTINPIQEQTLNIGTTQINITVYEALPGNTTPHCNLMEYKFNSFKETPDSLFFYGVEKDWDASSDPELPDGVGFKKGNIKLVGTADGIVGRIVIEEFFITTGERKIYKYGSRVLDRIESNSPIICTDTFYFNPKNELFRNEFSDYGLFKRIK